MKSHDITELRPSPGSRRRRREGGPGAHSAVPAADAPVAHDRPGGKRAPVLAEVLQQIAVPAKLQNDEELHVAQSAGAGPEQVDLESVQQSRFGFQNSFWHGSL